MTDILRWKKIHVHVVALTIEAATLDNMHTHMDMTNVILAVQGAPSIYRIESTHKNRYNFTMHIHTHNVHAYTHIMFNTHFVFRHTCTCKCM